MKIKRILRNGWILAFMMTTLVGCLSAQDKTVSPTVGQTAGQQTESQIVAMPSSDEEAAGYIRCPEVRPQMCTRDYRPVCAEILVYCIQAPCPEVLQTRANACSACADESVLGYREGACEAPAGPNIERDQRVR